MIYHLEEFTCEAFDNFIEEINKLKEWEKLKIFINSNWWNVSIKDSYLNIINSLDNVELVWVVCASAWFDLLYMANCEKTILDSAYWMIHIEAWGTQIWNWWVARWVFDKFKLESMKEEELKYKNILSKDEYKKYSNWEDVFVNSKRLKEIILAK